MASVNLSRLYPGPIAVRASAAMPKHAKEACFLPPVRDVLISAGYKDWRDLPRGVILTIAVLVDVQKISPANTPPSPELDFGDYTPGRFQWFLSDVRPLPEPIPAKGSLGLWRANFLDDCEFQSKTSLICRQSYLFANDKESN